MRFDSEALVDAFYASWRARDIDAGLAYCTDDIHMVFHFGNSVIFSGESRGKEAAREKLKQSGEDWEFVELRQQYTSVGADLVRCVCPFVFRHVRTGAILEGTLRHVFTLRDGRIAKFEAFIDIALLSSFLRSIGAKSSPLS